MSGLLDHLRRHIAHQGPLTIAQYMEACLGHPQFGYYMRRDPLGRAGDFITAPEISQMFGELIGLWTAQVWADMGAPTPFNWIELGPGRGTLSADALRAMTAAGGLSGVLDVHLVETSPVLRARQAEALEAWSPQWHDALVALPPGPGVVVANEFFDALPVRQYLRAEDGWRERTIALSADGELTFDQSPRLGIDPLLPMGLASAPVGAVVEVSPMSVGIARTLGERVMRDGAAVLIIDYGHGASAPGDTLQAVKAHAFHGVLDTPGEADLTAHVDFAALASAAREVGATIYGPVSQADFLGALGIGLRAERLKAEADTELRRAVDAAVERLTAPDAMGRLFKVMAIAAPGMPPPAGF